MAQLPAHGRSGSGLVGDAPGHHGELVAPCPPNASPEDDRIRIVGEHEDVTLLNAYPLQTAQTRGYQISAHALPATGLIYGQVMDVAAPAVMTA